MRAERMTLLNERRVREAARQLSAPGPHNSATIQQLALSLGYSSSTSFIIAFKKVMGMQEPLRTDTVRSVMTQVLAIVDVAGQDKQTLLNGIHDMNFKDLEDSCQHQAAMKESCDYLLTFNVKDYSGAEIPVLTPQEFVNKIKTE